eukprot:jgi/Ulvmu1/4447/UM002_0172.1
MILFHVACVMVGEACQILDGFCDSAGAQWCTDSVSHPRPTPRLLAHSTSLHEASKTDAPREASQRSFYNCLISKRDTVLNTIVSDRYACCVSSCIAASSCCALPSDAVQLPEQRTRVFDCLDTVAASRSCYVVLELV